jgi:phosphatidylglycerophosphate synthase
VYKRRWPETVAAIISAWLISPMLGAFLISLIASNFGLNALLRYIVAIFIQACLLTLLLRALRRRIGPEPNTFANALTLVRVDIGCILAALVLSGARDRMAAASVVVWALVVFAATMLDWLDGPIARREGPTRFGAVLDIESDSWLTLWCAVAAVALGGLPWICVLPPIVRYIHPLLALRTGKLPSGGSPWWSRATGVAQMATLLAAFAPITGAARDTILGIVIWPVSIAQLATIVALLALHPTSERA